MRKLHDKILVVIFCGFIFVMALLLVVLPKQEISVYEKRSLAKFPQFSFASVFNGKWEGKVEDYINDHFPARNTFKALNSYGMLISGRNGIDGVYKGKDGYLINTPVETDEKAYNDNVNAVVEFVKNTNLPATVMIIPETGFIMKDKLPKNHRLYKNDEMLGELNKEIGGYVRWVDVMSEFEKEKNNTELYYKTDHHYTTAGAFIAYNAFCTEHGFGTVTDYDTEQYDGFFGTTYSKSALWKEKGDVLEVWRYPNNITVEIDDATYPSMWFDEHLDEVDKYPVFLNGNQPFERIINPDSEQRKLLLVKDSFAHALVPFLANHYSTIDMVDLRYYFDSVSDLVLQNGYDEVLFVYGVDSFFASNDISILR